MHQAAPPRAKAHHRVSLLLLSTASRLDGRTANALQRRLLRACRPLLTLRLVQATVLVPLLPNYNRLLALLRRDDPSPLPVLLAHRRECAETYKVLVDELCR